MNDDLYLNSYLHKREIIQLSVVFHGFVGIKHLMLVMFQTISYQNCSWLLHVIYVMIPMGKSKTIYSIYSCCFVFSVHPRYKHDVGYRLSRSGLAIAYGHQIEFQGPIVDNVDYVSGGSTVNITYRAVSSIELRNPKGFDVCCQGSQCLNDTIWIETTVASKNDLTITVTVPNECVGRPLYGIRYLWRESPCPFKQAAVYSGTDANLPTPPYLKLF